VLAAVASVLVAVGVVVALLLHAFPLPSSGGSSSVRFGTPLEYSQVIGPAEAAQAGRTGGPWTADDALGYDLSQSYTGAGGLVTNCTTVWENSSPVVFPATAAGASPGSVAAWIVLSVNSTGALLLTTVTELSGAVVGSNGIVVEGSCTGTFTEFGAIPASVVDSGVVATAALAAGGSSFLTSHPGAEGYLGLFGPVWDVIYTTCSPFGTSGTGEEFSAGFYATNGTLLLTLGPGAVPC
jgi:hypothetical protein